MDERTGQRIKERRIARGLSQAALSRLTGIHSSTLSHIEGGFVKPWPGYLSRIAQALGTTVTELEVAQAATPGTAANG